MNSTNETFSTISHQDIYNFPFQYKLWIAVNSVTCNFIKWNIDGTQIEIQLIALDHYLNRPKSIFKIESRSSFVTELRSYAFQLTKREVKEVQNENTQEAAVSASEFSPEWASPKYSEIVVHFSHMYFLRHRIDLLANIRQTNDTPICSPALVGVSKEKPAFTDGNRSEVDLCYRPIGTSTKLYKAHFKHQLILNFLSETKALECKLKASELNSNAKGQEGNDEDSMIELSAELFENPHDSVLYMGDEHRTAYAGFYGNCTDEQVLKFFGNYLPRYENENNDEGEKRIADLNPTAKASSHPNSFEINVSFNEEPAIPSEDVTQQNISLPSTSLHLPQQNVSLPSTLEPIFIPDEEKDEDILMDEFIKFKEQSENQTLDQSIEEPKIKMEEICNKQENEENDDNFKNFFSHYRASLSLLYEKQ